MLTETFLNYSVKGKHGGVNKYVAETKRVRERTCTCLVILSLVQPNAADHRIACRCHFRWLIFQFAPNSGGEFTHSPHARPANEWGKVHFN